MRLRRGSTDLVHGLTRSELDRLATYNAECSRGIAHTEAWRERMADLQRRFDESRLASIAARAEESPA